MSYLPEQVSPCPSCGQAAGWWCGLSSRSMIFHEVDGDVTEKRLWESKVKHCASCDADISSCVSQPHKAKEGVE